MNNKAKKLCQYNKLHRNECHELISDVNVSWIFYLSKIATNSKTFKKVLGSSLKSSWLGFLLSLYVFIYVMIIRWFTNFVGNFWNAFSCFWKQFSYQSSYKKFKSSCFLNKVFSRFHKWWSMLIKGSFWGLTLKVIVTLSGAQREILKFFNGWIRQISYTSYWLFQQCSVPLA